MARNEQEREDLLREATALVERVELNIDGFEQPVVAGFRRDGAACFYFGSDPVFQFNSRRQWRRGFWNDRLLKAEAGAIVQLQRQRQDQEVQLLRHDLSTDEAEAYCRMMCEHLRQLADALRTDSASIVGQVPEAADVCARISRWLAELPAIIEIAAVPNVGSTEAGRP